MGITLDRTLVSFRSERQLSLSRQRLAYITIYWELTGVLLRMGSTWNWYPRAKIVWGEGDRDRRKPFV